MGTGDCLLLLFALLNSVVSADGAPRNFTIDDINGDERTGVLPVYTPPDGWLHATSNCSDCLARLDGSLTNNRTWTEQYYSPNQNNSTTVDIAFNGTGVFVYFIEVSSAQYGTNATFILDDYTQASYVQEPSSSATGDIYQYNKLVYANPRMRPGPHTLRILNGGGSQSSLTLFDYIQYTYDPNHVPAMPPPPPPPHPLGASSQSTPLTRGAIAGIAIGSTIALILVKMFAVLFLQSRKLRPQVYRFSFFPRRRISEPPIKTVVVFPSGSSLSCVSPAHEQEDDARKAMERERAVLDFGRPPTVLGGRIQ